MVPRILSIAGPLFVYATLAVLARGLWQERKNLDWIALAPAVAGLLASFYLLAPTHRLFFDEDIYISIAHNLTRAPIAQVTLLGGPDDIAVSTYYKQPAGWPSLMSLVFMATGRSEAVAFAMVRVLYALAIAAVYMLARALQATRIQALVAGMIFGAAPVCFWFSASPGTDMASALFATIGFWGIASGNAPLAVGGLGMSAQIRLEMIAIVPLLWLASKIPVRWKLLTAALVLPQIAHTLWVLSVAPVLAAAEGVDSAFAMDHLIGNLKANLAYLSNPMVFPAGATLLAIVFFARRLRSNSTDAQQAPALVLAAPLMLMAVYLFFYAGSFDVNPRYSIQLLAPLAVLAATACRHSWLVLLTLLLPFTQQYVIGSYIETLAADHALSVQFASQLGPQDLVVSSEHEMFLNQGLRAMSSVLASEQPARLDAEIKKEGRVIYHSGARTTVEGSQAWTADRWVKSNHTLDPIDSRVVGGMRIAFYEILLQNFDGEARQRGAFNGESRDGPLR